MATKTYQVNKTKNGTLAQIDSTGGTVEATHSGKARNLETLRARGYYLNGGPKEPLA